MPDQPITSSYLFQITVLFFAASVTKNIIFWLSLWQTRKYKFRRVIIHLFETREGRLTLVGPENLAKLFAFGFFIATLVNESLIPYFPYIVCAAYFYSTLRFIINIINKNIIIPKITVRVGIVVVVCGIISSFLFFFPLVDQYLWLLVIDKVLTIILWSALLMWSIFSDFVTDVVINKATEKINSRDDLLVIGIAGSHGKGEIKEYINVVLSQKFNVLRTRPDTYTLEDIADTVNKKLTDKKQVLIADITPFKVGDIREISQMIKPKIGVLTSLNDQYISLFKSQEKIISANFELIDSLPRDGIALLNGSSSIVKKLYPKVRRKKILYTANSSLSVKQALIASNIRVLPYYIAFSVSLGEQKLGKFTVRLLGGHVVENMLPAIYLGFHMGMKVSEIRKGLLKLKPLRGIMYPYITPKKIVLVDDTYHSNPASIKKALNYLQQYNKKKVLVLQPMEELGKNAKRDHVSLANKIGEICDELFLTNKNFEKDIRDGINKSESRCDIHYLSPKMTADYIQNTLGKGDIVLFCGGESKSVLRLLEKENISI